MLQTILVVEDHPVFRRLISTALHQRAALQIIEAADGLEAVCPTALHEPGVGAGGRAPGARDRWPAIRESQCRVDRACRCRRAPSSRDCLLFGRRAIVDGFTRFIAGALNAADAAIALATQSHRTRLRRELRTQDVDIDGAIERGTYLSFDAGIAPDPVRFLEAINSAREAAAKAGAEAVQLEQPCSELARDVDILCAYPVPHAKNDQALARVCAGHTAVSAS